MILIKIFSIVLPNLNLKFFLKTSYYIMNGFRSRCKEIRLVITLLMKIDHYLRIPLLKQCYSLSAFNLSLPSPVAIQIKIIMIGSACRPRFHVFSRKWVYIIILPNRIIVPIHISISSIRIDTRINHHNGIF